MNCGNCKYLGKELLIDKTTADDPSDWEFQVPTGYHHCDFIKHNKEDGRIPIGQPLAFVEDGSDYYAALKVKSDFGCIEFKPII